MLRWFLPDVPIVVGRRRVLAAEIVAREHPDAVLVMDDGFQHLPLKKHVSILLDPERPRNTHCLPAGPYREPRFERNRADLVLGERFKVVKEPLRFVSGLSGETMKVKEAGVLCALGRPQGFLQDLDATGMRITGHRLLHDHDPLVAGTILDGLSGQGPIVVTAKDWVKLRQRSDLDLTRFVVALQKISVQPSDEFEAWLKERLAH
jgi:tetraacyldisaccharide 4'-kinase